MASQPRTCRIVALEGIYCPIPTFTSPTITFSVTTHERMTRDTPLETVRQRIHSAEILIITIFPLTRQILSPDFTPNLRAICVVAVGTDTIDLDACRERGIRVFNCPGSNTETVAEHAIALYFAARRRIVEMHQRVVRGQWVEQGTLAPIMLKVEQGGAPLALREEKVGIVGYGAVGKRIAELCRALGMEVRISGRKGLAAGAKDEGSGRVPFETILRECTSIFIAVPRNPYTLGLISEAELKTMHPRAVLINVSRGGVVDDDALLQALRERSIAGAGLDVFAIEPAGPSNSRLVEAASTDSGENILPLVASPHFAWISEETSLNYQRMTKGNVEGFLSGDLPIERTVL